ncbi:MAG: polyprenyl synthetase family protein [Cyanobacteria bacterium REEB65]|nr:polyprenyl synthetase family protein [Cyanobacteria bacterium REEB65]
MQATKSSIAAFSAQWVPQIDRTLGEAIGQGQPLELFEAMRYAALGPGKRLRPLLVVAACEAAGGRGEDSLELAAAVEMAHAFSLVHDDLPCMDDDDLRRGRPTVHKVYGEAIALLAGDALMARACGYLGGLARPWAAAAVAELADAISGGMIPGQVLDMQWEGKPDEADLDRLHDLKTGRLIVAACRMGALGAAAPPAVATALGEYGAHVGLAFQIADDILDAADPAGSDILKHKATYPGRYGLERTRELATSQVAKAVAALERLGGRGSAASCEVLAAIARYAVERDH